MSILGKTVKADRGSMAAGRDLNIGTTPEEVQAMIVAALAQQQDDRVAGLARQLGATEGIVQRVLTVLAPHVEQHELQPEALPDLVRRLTEQRVAALREQRLLAEAETDPDLRTLRQSVVVAQTDGDDAEANSALEAIQAFHRQRRLARQAMQTRLAAAIESDARSEAEALAQRAQIARSQLRHRDAATLLAEAADLTTFDPEISWRYRMSQADALETSGNELGDTPALVLAIKVYERVLSAIDLEKNLDQWVGTKNNLGATLRDLAQNADPQGNLRRSLNELQEALHAIQNQPSSLQWAYVNQNLGVTLRELGGIENNAPFLLRANHHLDCALVYFTERRMYNEAALAQDALGLSCVALGKLQGEPKILQRAIVMHKNALKIVKPMSQPAEWAGIMNNLANALISLGIFEKDSNSFDRAIRIYKRLEKIFTRDRNPMAWSGIQHNIGNTLRIIGQRGRKVENLFCAIRYFEKAIEERKRELAPQLWAETQQNLALTKSMIGELTRDGAVLGDALICIDGALEEFRAGKAPLNIETAERLRVRIMAALRGLEG